MKTQTQDIDKGWKKIKKQLLKQNGLVVAVGVISGGGQKKYSKHSDVNGNGEASDIDLAKLATVQEFGSGKIPPRPFMRQTEEREKENARKAVKKLQNALYSLRIDAVTLGDKLGVWYVGKIRETIRNGKFRANSEVTKALKGSSKPLIDTGRLIQSIDYELRDK